MASDATLNHAVLPRLKWHIDSHVLWLIVSAAVGLALWFMPVMSGLTLTGQHALAVVIFTVLLWITQATPTGVASLLMMAIVLCFMPEVKPATFLGFWTQDTMWFILVCFMFSAVLESSGLGKRLTVYVFSIRSLILVDLALLGLNTLFSALGMNASFPKLALLFPLVTSVALMSGMDKEHPYVRHLAIMINVLANTTGTLVYSGFVMNPALGPLGGFSINYSTWLQWFFVPALIYTLISFIVIYFLFLPPRGAHFDPKAAHDELKKLGPVSQVEMKAIVWLLIAVSLWATGGITGLPTGFAAVLVASLMLLPGIGMLNFKEYVQKTDWNAVFMLMGVLAIGTLVATGFAKWIWGHILPAHMPDSPILAVTIISFLVELLHIPLGSTATSQALAVPSLAEYAHTFGASNVAVSFVTYMSIVGQQFFPYQNAALVVGLGYGLWKPRDILKFGSVMFILTPLVMGIVLYPWWVYGLVALMRLIVGISGASGVILGIELLRALARVPQCETHLVMTEGARLTLRHETDLDADTVAALADRAHPIGNLAAAISSGSFQTDGMVVMPCSMKTLAGVVSGYTDNLLLRAVDVCLKERRRVVLVPRELPFNAVHLRNLAQAAQDGCIIMPPMLTFYNHPRTVQDMINHMVGKVMAMFGLTSAEFVPWTGGEPSHAD